MITAIAKMAVTSQVLRFYRLATVPNAAKAPARVRKENFIVATKDFGPNTSHLLESTTVFAVSASRRF